MRPIALTAVVTVMTWTIAAHADWQYTRWGMTPEQTIAASKGELKRCEGQICSGQTTAKEAALLLGDYQSGEFNFTAFMCFEKDTNKLSRVRLSLTDPEKGSSLIGALRTKYGEPSGHDRTEFMEVFIWRDQTDQFSVMVIGGGSSTSVSLSYQPRLTDSNKGL